MIFYKIKVKLIIFILVSFFILNDTNVFAGSVDSRKYFKEFINKRGGVNTPIQEEPHHKYLEYQKAKFGSYSEKYEFNSNSNHVWVEEISTHKRFDSYTHGINGILTQHHDDCVLNSLDNYFYLEVIGDQIGSDGTLYYTDFSRKLRNTAGGTGMYMFYAFINLFSKTEDTDNFKTKMSDDFTQNKADVFKVYDFIQKSHFVYGKGLKVYLEDIFNEFKTANASLYQPISLHNPTSKNEAMEFLKYFFTYMKNDEMGLAGDFDFTKDIPHLLWLFREYLGLTVLDVDNIITDYIKNYKPPPIPIVTKPVVSTTPMIPIIPSHVQASISLYTINENSLKFLSDFSNVYLYIIRNIVISEICSFDRIRKNDRKSGGFDISTSYGMNKKQADSYDIKESLSVNMNFRTKILKESNINFGFIFEFNYNLLSLGDLRGCLYDDEDLIKLYYITFGAVYRKIYNYDNTSNFNLGLLFNWKIDNDRKYFKDSFSLGFGNRNITIFLQDNRVFGIDKLLISSIVFTSSVSYTDVIIDQIKAESGFDNYDINDTNYHLVLLNFSLNLRKNVNIGFVKNSSNVVLDFISNLNESKNNFSLRNRYCGERNAVVDNIEKIKNSFTIKFKNDLEIKKHITIGIEVGKNLNIKRSMFFRINLIISF